MEIWKNIEGYEGYYQVSNLGRVKNLGRYVKSINGAKSFKRERILKPDKSKENKRGQFYLRVTLSKENKQERFQVHRLVAKHFIDKVEGKNIINHKDGNPENNNYLNLEWSNYSENELHSYNELGKINQIRKLSDRDVFEIRRDYFFGNSTVLAQKYNVHKTTILNVKNNRYYV